MALYFFDIHDGQPLPDQQGLELDGLVQAQAYAFQMVKSFLKQDAILFWRAHFWAITIRDAAGSVLYRMQFNLTQGADAN